MSVRREDARVDVADRSLAKILVERSYIRGDFVLASGRRSNFYFDCRLTTCFAEAMPLFFARADMPAAEAFVSMYSITCR